MDNRFITGLNNIELIYSLQKKMYLSLKIDHQNTYGHLSLLHIHYIHFLTRCQDEFNSYTSVLLYLHLHFRKFQRSLNERIKHLIHIHLSR